MIKSRRDPKVKEFKQVGTCRMFTTQGEIPLIKFVNIEFPEEVYVTDGINVKQYNSMVHQDIPCLPVEILAMIVRQFKLCYQYWTLKVA